MPVTDPHSLDEQLHRLLTLETAADHIHGWHPSLFPGMLQTADYARASITAAAPALPPHDVEKRAAGRTVRIDTLGRAAGRTARFVVGEDASLTLSAGRPPSPHSSTTSSRSSHCGQPSKCGSCPAVKRTPACTGRSPCTGPAPDTACSSSTWAAPRSSTPRKRPCRSSTPATMWGSGRRARWTRFG